MLGDYKAKGEKKIRESGERDNRQKEEKERVEGREKEGRQTKIDKKSEKEINNEWNSSSPHFSEFAFSCNYRIFP